MKYAVDRIENDIAVLENIESREIIEISIDLLPDGIHDGDVIKYENNTYLCDELTKEERLNRIKAKMDKLKNL